MGWKNQFQHTEKALQNTTFLSGGGLLNLLCEELLCAFTSNTAQELTRVGL